MILCDYYSRKKKVIFAVIIMRKVFPTENMLVFPHLLPPYKGFAKQLQGEIGKAWKGVDAFKLILEYDYLTITGM
jgi:hypothetical protein